MRFKFRDARKFATTFRHTSITAAGVGGDALVETSTQVSRQAIVSYRHRVGMLKYRVISRKLHGRYTTEWGDETNGMCAARWCNIIVIFRK